MATELQVSALVKLTVNATLVHVTGTHTYTCFNVNAVSPSSTLCYE